MSYITVSIRHIDGTFSTSLISEPHLRHLFRLPGFLNGDITYLQNPISSFRQPLIAPNENGYVLVDARTKTITQWGIFPGLEVISARALSVDAHSGWLKRTPETDKLLTFFDEKLRGADYNGVSPSAKREALRPYITAASYFHDVLQDPIKVDFEPFDSDVELVKKLKELAWAGRRRDWLTQERPNLVDCCLSFPGWQLERVPHENLMELKSLVEGMVELDDADHEAWHKLADKLGYELETSSFSM